ncbi:TetR/AcrR family transcriptional regulator [Homoserinibacter sp. YIM 151385]|uniref:TetR/AcrR family transcriptional regulator n=1 Tax=Homoserinibacter sp. YIM 151385 TaxID=2985506 RepID=UPI0022F023C5|nr:TetR/AcrR family transcriptional regulator [Homoserinibacter sp. YIM 151385]WBU37579.1 TetR/AcrR family transcriptional regulator [Homoserinibacter sp. YIM 151385]
MAASPQHDRRASLSGADDAKVRATRRKLSDALHDAVLDRGAKGVSVADLVSRSGVSRSTFYTHFANVDELALAATADLFADLAPIDVDRRAEHRLSRAEITRRGLGELLDALLANRHLLALAAEGPSAAGVRERFVDQMAASLGETIRIERPDAAEAEIEAASQYIAAGTLRLLLRSVERGGEDRGELLDVVFGLLPEYLTGG